MEKYLNLLPTNGKKPNLYLQTMKRPKPFCWYTSSPLGINRVHSVVTEMLKNSGLDGFFTNHSLRRTCATRLFQAGADVKLVKEITGHVSDSVHKYQTTSDDQRMHLSSIIQGDVLPIKLSQAEPMHVVEEPKSVPVENKFHLGKLKLPVSTVKIDQNAEKVQTNMQSVSDVIANAVKSVGSRRAKLTIEVELLD